SASRGAHDARLSPGRAVPRRIERVVAEVDLERQALSTRDVEIQGLGRISPAHRLFGQLLPVEEDAEHDGSAEIAARPGRRPRRGGETDRSLKSRVLAPEVELEPREGVDAEPLRVERSVELKRAAEHRAILAMGELENEEAPKVLLDLDGLEVAQEAASAVGEGDLVEPRRRKLERAEQRMLDPRALRRQRRQRPVDRRSVDQANAREGASTRVARPRSSLGIAV